MRTFSVLALLLLSACSELPDVKTALDAVAVGGSLGYDGSYRLCSSAEQTVIRSAQDPESKPAQLAEIRKLCDPVFASFEEARGVHALALAVQAHELGQEVVPLLERALKLLKAAKEAADGLAAVLLPKKEPYP